jgi:hypothetical protein
MEDEIIKNTGQIWKKLRSDGGAFDKIRSVLGEILVIGFAVSFSIWINNRAEYHKEQQDVLDFLLICREELAGDNADLLRCKDEIETVGQDNQFLLRITPEILDSIKKNGQELSYNGTPLVRKTHLAGYEGFKTSGRLGTIENKNLKKKIMEYYEVLMPSLRQSEEYYNTNTIKTLELILDRGSEKGKDAYLEKRMRMQLAMNFQIASSMGQSYSNVLVQVRDLLAELDKEILLMKDDGIII